MERTRAVLLPGSVLPADLAYSELVKSLGPHIDAALKDLEVYAGPEPPEDYTLDTEVEGLRRFADERGWDSFHLVGYSGGGASALAFTAKHPDRVLSLALLEPAWAGSWDWTPEHRHLWREYDQLQSAPRDEFMKNFIRLGVKEGVKVAPVGTAAESTEPPAWMDKRPAGILALLNTFKTYDLNRSALAAYDRPVYFALGGLSNPHDYAAIAEVLIEVFPDFQLEVFEERHHFDPPHRVEPDRVAASLKALWKRAAG
ncbi:alpha/beta hydrolase [Paenarthrobacter sp. DKR-5]|uniref:alpha/beta fold hydrolase n=1 Tax=Paenarthrobacter sp. DKR-5 TaxID=2835535 RepID=UPI001BDC74C3|nr:alpha/beta hydrolase [Paenarthrobacter sp. DKR-5]MBT1004116.1 alpha/beta hydrolase [Paenarthrobacter sp. DKR-5]